VHKNKGGRVDSQLVQQTEHKQKYWHKLLEQVTEVIKFLVQAGLAFRGSDESFGSPGDGNYLQTNS